MGENNVDDTWVWSSFDILLTIKSNRDPFHKGIMSPSLKSHTVYTIVHESYYKYICDWSIKSIQ